TSTSTNTPTAIVPPTATMTPSQTATAASSVNITSQVSASADDAEEPLTGGLTDLNSSDLELGADGTTSQRVGMRFNNLTIPQGAFITNAYVEFEVDRK